LRGAGIVVTRPARQAAGLAQQIAAVGGTPLVFPALVILPLADDSKLRDAWSRLDDYDAAIFVSANAVEYGVVDARRWPSSLALFAPGPGTAAALAAVGLNAVRIPATTMDSEGLLALPELASIEGKRIAIFRGGGGRELLASALTARGASVEFIECYRRAKPTSSAEGLVEAWRDQRIDALTITSSEGLANLWEILDARARSHLRGTPTFVPHPRIAERAKALNVATVVVTAPTDAGLIASLLDYFAAHPKP
jgi:uroporphyrinogen-III synthase